MANNNIVQIPLKRRVPRENQEILRYHDKSPLYSLETCHKFDWKLFMWFASLEKVENYIYLFIVIWDSAPVRNNEYLKEFEEEITTLIINIKGLNISASNDTSYYSMLDDYKNYRLHNQSLRQSLVHNAWAELEGCGLKYYSNAVSAQLDRCTVEQIKELRWMVMCRIKSFRFFARQVKEDKGKKQNEMLINKENSQDNQELLRENEKLKAQIADLTKENLQQQQDNQEFLRENEKLKVQVTELIKENSQQQAALGNLTNVSWNDDDPNNTKKLNADITDLQDALSDFTMVQGGDYKIIDEAAAVLLKSSKCKAVYPSPKANLALGTLLQKLAINTILEAAKKYFDGPFENQNITLEREIVNTTKNLINYIESFKNHRKGDDDITKITPTKIRQHIYSSLSNRGLPIEHPLIKETANNLLDEMNRFREVVDEETRDELHDQAIQITHKVINIFCFRLKTQAFEPTCRFFEVGQLVDGRLMQGAFGYDDSKKLEVEACGFPCIGIFDVDNYKIFTKAQVVTRSKN